MKTLKQMTEAHNKMTTENTQKSKIFKNLNINNY